MSEVWERLAARFSPRAIADWLAEVLPDFLVAVLTFAVFWLIWKGVSRGFHALTERSKIDLTARDFVQTTLKYILLTIGVVTALGQMGIDMASILASLGIAGLTLGFAAKDALSNIISGIFIFWDRPFVIGDLIEVEGNYGRVDEITMRSTRVVTVDGKMLAIPNTKVLNSTVASYTNFPHLRIDIDVTVAVDSDLGRVRSLLLSLVQEDARFMQAPPPTVVVTALNDYNVALQLRAWLDDEKQHVPVRFELREKVFTRLTEAGVDMPFETLRIETLPSAPPDTGAAPPPTPGSVAGI